MKTNLFLSIAGILLCLGMLSSCKSDDGPNISYKASRMDLSGATALTILSNNEGRAEASEEFQSGLFKVDEQGNISVAAVYLVTDEEGNTSTKEVPARVDCGEIFNIGEDYLVLRWCGYFSLDNNEPIGMPQLYQTLIVRKADGRIFGCGGHEFLENIFTSSSWNTPIAIKVSSDEYILTTESVTQEGKVEYLARLKFDGQQLTCQEMSTNGVVGPDAVYYNGNIYSVGIVYSVGGRAGIRFDNGGYDIFEKNSFGDPEVTSYLTLNDGLAAVRCSFDNYGHVDGDITFNIINATRPGDATLTEVASLKNSANAYFIIGSYETGSKILLQHNQPDSNTSQWIPGEKAGYTVVDKSAGTWELYEPEFGIAEGITISAKNLYKGRIWGVEQVEGKLQPKALWINPSTLESGTVDLDFEVNGIDIRESVQDYGNGHLVIYGTRRADNANVVIEVDITTGKATTVFSHTTYEITTLVPLN